jgi:hypothetical protein
MPHQGNFSTMMLVLAAVSVCLQQSPLTPSDLVIGGVPFGADTASVRAQLGAPLKVSDGDWKYSGLRVHLASGRVAMVHVASTRWSTPRGISIGSSVANVRKAYGEPDWSNAEQIGYVLRPDTSMFHQGVSFEVRKGRVTYIVAGIVSVTVH